MTHKYLIFGVVFLFQSLCSCPAIGQQQYEKIGFLKCDKQTFTVTTKCLNLGPYDNPCVSQTIEIKNNPDNDKNYIALDLDKNNKGYLDGLYTEWVCMKGKSDYYILLGANNGGNCDTCEWFVIMETTGESIVSSNTKDNKDNYQEFKKVYNELGLGKWPRDSFTEIPHYYEE